MVWEGLYHVGGVLTLAAEERLVLRGAAGKVPVAGIER